MVIEYTIKYEGGQLTVTQRVGPGGTGTTSKSAKDGTKEDEAKDGTRKDAPKDGAHKEEPKDGTKPRESNQLGTSAEGAPKAATYGGGGTSAPAVIVMGPVIVTCDGLEGGSGEPTTTGTDDKADDGEEG